MASATKSTIRRSATLAGTLALLLLAIGAPGAAAATTYTETLSFTPPPATCFLSGGSRICFSVQLISPITVVAGDVINLTETLSGPMTVPGSKSSNFFFAEFIDTGFQTATTESDTTTPVVSFTGYSGPPNPLGTSFFPITETNNNAYEAVAGFCCGYRVPDSGFSFTGVDVTYDITDSDPLALDALVLGTSVVVPEPASWALMLAGFFGLGAALRARRARRAPAFA